MEEARTDDSFGDIDAWTCWSESVVGDGSLARSRTSPATVALLLFFFRWVDSTSPSHCWRNALNISSSFLFILTVIYIQYLETDMKLRHGNFGRWRSESFRISNLPPKTNTNLNKFFHFDENIEIYREMHLWSVPCIDCSSSCFGVLYATTVDWQMIQRYLRHLSFYSAPSCLNKQQMRIRKNIIEWINSWPNINFSKLPS